MRKKLLQLCNHTPSTDYMCTGSSCRLNSALTSLPVSAGLSSYRSQQHQTSAECQHSLHLHQQEQPADKTSPSRNYTPFRVALSAGLQLDVKMRQLVIIKHYMQE